MLQEALAKAAHHQSLSRKEAALAMREIMRGEAEPMLIAALLTALRMKGETAEEIAGFAETMRAFATAVPAKRRPLVDTCGTGGDHSGSFNISTTAAFVVAGAGVAVAKHGNRSASSRCGSADVLEALGVNIELAPGDVARAIDRIGIGFLYARALHTAMKHVAPVRAALRIRTVFNLLGPLTNPAGADGQVMGVFDPALAPTLAEVLRQLGTRHAFVVSGHDGLDEISLGAPTTVAEVRGGEVHVYTVTPDDLGLSPAGKELLAGGDAAENAAILESVLGGEPGARRDVTLANAAPALVAGGAAENLREGVTLAARAIDSGYARERLAALRGFGRE